MTATMQGPKGTEPVVLVGVDGSDSATDALLWAVEFAASRNYRVRVVCAFLMPVFATSGGVAEFVEPGTNLADAAAAALDHTLESLPNPPVAVETSAIAGRPAAVLRDLARDPEVVLTVVGRRGLGRLSTVLLGSVSRSLINNATSAVAVVPRGSHDIDGPTVVGVDGSDGSMAALRWAAEHANPPITAVHAWRVHYVHTVPMLPRSEFGRLAQARLDATQEQFETAPFETASFETGRCASKPQRIDYRLIEGDARAVLVSRHNAAIVVGTCHGMPARMLGSVAAALTVRSSGPVIVVPPLTA